MTAWHRCRNALWRLVSTTALVFLVSCTLSPPSQADSSSHEYDSYFWTANARFTPQHHWVWLKAQCYQESLLDARAVSKAGAMGLCQFMPSTWSEVSERLRLNASVYNPKANAYAAAYYMGRLEAQWRLERSRRQKQVLAQASYNAGLGNVLRWQKACDWARLWEDMLPCVDYSETRDYVTLIEKHYNRMSGGTYD